MATPTQNWSISRAVQAATVATRDQFATGAVLAEVNGERLYEGQMLAYFDLYRIQSGLFHPAFWLAWVGPDGEGVAPLVRRTAEWLAGYLLTRQLAAEQGIAVGDDEVDGELTAVFRAVPPELTAVRLVELGLTPDDFYEGIRACLARKRLRDEAVCAEPPSDQEILDRMRDAGAVPYKAKLHKLDDKKSAALARWREAFAEEAAENAFDAWLADRLAQADVSYGEVTDSFVDSLVNREYPSPEELRALAGGDPAAGGKAPSDGGGAPGAMADGEPR